MGCKTVARVTVFSLLATSANMWTPNQGIIDVPSSSEPGWYFLISWRYWRIPGTLVSLIAGVLMLFCFSAAITRAALSGGMSRMIAWDPLAACSTAGVRSVSDPVRVTSLAIFMPSDGATLPRLEYRADDEGPTAMRLTVLAWMTLWAKPSEPRLPRKALPVTGKELDAVSSAGWAGLSMISAMPLSSGAIGLMNVASPTVATAWLASTERPQAFSVFGSPLPSQMSRTSLCPWMPPAALTASTAALAPAAASEKLNPSAGASRSTIIAIWTGAPLKLAADAGPTPPTARPPSEAARAVHSATRCLVRTCPPWVASGPVATDRSWA